jgi:hypothetical protein
VGGTQPYENGSGKPNRTHLTPLCRSHNPKVARSSPAAAIEEPLVIRGFLGDVFGPTP